MLLQAPIIAILICLIFENITPAVPFITALSAIWFGTNNGGLEKFDGEKQGGRSKTIDPPKLAKLAK